MYLRTQRGRDRETEEYVGTLAADNRTLKARGGGGVLWWALCPRCSAERGKPTAMNREGNPCVHFPPNILK